MKAKRDVCLFYKTITIVPLDTVSRFHLAESEFLESHISNSLNGLTENVYSG